MNKSEAQLHQQRESDKADISSPPPTKHNPLANPSAVEQIVPISGVVVGGTGCGAIAPSF